MSRPKNPDAFWNQLDGRPGTPPAHVIADIRMRHGECWVRCACGFYAEAPAPSGKFVVRRGPDGNEDVGRLMTHGLSELYAAHISTAKRQPLLAGGQ